jgi:hypothetical protein
VLTYALSVPVEQREHLRVKTFTVKPFLSTISSVPIVALETLPPVFAYRQARAAGLSNRRIYALRDAGVIEQVGRGLFLRLGARLVDVDLAEALARGPQGTLCLMSALSHHALTDVMPDTHDLALPRGNRHPAVSGAVRWHSFHRATFPLGRERGVVGGHTAMFVYSAPRSVVDAFRLHSVLGSDVANEALRRWLRRGGQPAEALAIARQLPAAMSALRHALEVLL